MKKWEKVGISGIYTYTHTEKFFLRAKVRKKIHMTKPFIQNYLLFYTPLAVKYSDNRRAEQNKIRFTNV